MHIGGNPSELCCPIPSLLTELARSSKTFAGIQVLVSELNRAVDGHGSLLLLISPSDSRTADFFL